MITLLVLSLCLGSCGGCAGCGKQGKETEQTENEIKVDVKGKYGESATEETLTIPAGKTLNLNGKTAVGAKGLIVVQGIANNAGGLFLETQMQMDEGGAFVNDGLVVRPEHKHKAVKDAAVAATCTKDGLQHTGIVIRALRSSRNNAVISGIDPGICWEKSR